MDARGQIACAAGPPIPRGAIIEPPTGKDLSWLPQTLQTYYSLVNQVQWGDLGYAGSWYGVESLEPITQTGLNFDFRDDVGDNATVRVMGITHCGEMMVFTPDGRAGWRSTSGHAEITCTIEEMIEWLFSNLLAGREPSGNYD